MEIETPRRPCCTQALAIAGAGILTLLLLVGVPWVGKLTEYRDTIDQNSERLEKLMSIAAERPTLQREFEAISVAASSSELYLHNPNGALAAAELQGWIKQAIEATGASLVSTQALPSLGSGESSEISVRVRMQGETEAAADVLHDLESRLPVLVIDNLSIRQQRSRRIRRGRQVQDSGSENLDVSFDVTAYLWSGSK